MRVEQLGPDEALLQLPDGTMFALEVPPSYPFEPPRIRTEAGQHLRLVRAWTPVMGIATAAVELYHGNVEVVAEPRGEAMELCWTPGTPSLEARWALLLARVACLGGRGTAFRGRHAVFLCTCAPLWAFAGLCAML